MGHMVHSNSGPMEQTQDEPLCEVNCVRVRGCSAPNSALIVSMHVGKHRERNIGMTVAARQN